MSDESGNYGSGKKAKRGVKSIVVPLLVVGVCILAVICIGPAVRIIGYLLYSPTAGDAHVVQNDFGALKYESFNAEYSYGTITIVGMVKNASDHDLYDIKATAELYGKGANHLIDATSSYLDSNPITQGNSSFYKLVLSSNEKPDRLAVWLKNSRGEMVAPLRFVPFK